jgi:hypothetical protein
MHGPSQTNFFMEEKDLNPTPLKDPFERIGMALSGGGYRAAAFSLGSLSYLNHLQYDGRGLNQSIEFMSSASGGTIANLFYTVGIHKGDRFTSTYQRMLDALSGDKVLNKALTVLNDDQEWEQQAKRRNIINAFAKAYDALFFNGDTFAVYWDKDHIKAFEVCLNATEFYRGLSFRFQTDGTYSHSQWIGNNYLWFNTQKLETFKKIRLADALAASSCFPGGFEPIVYPEDFSYAGLAPDELREAVIYENYEEQQFPLNYIPPAATVPDPKQPSYINCFGLMDGGMTDNQGLSSLMKADLKRRRRKKPEPFSLMIVTDVASYFMDSYEVPETGPAAGWRNKNLNDYIKRFQGFLGKVSKLPVVAAIVIALLAITCYIFPYLWLWIVAALFAGVAITLGGLAYFIQRSPETGAIITGAEQFDVKTFLQKTLNMGKSFSDAVITKLSYYLRQTRLRFVEQMLKARLSSVMTMVSDINLKQVRRLIYEMFYDNQIWDNRRMPNFIYELSQHNAQARHNRISNPKRLGWTPTPADLNLLLNGLDHIQPVAEDARVMGTTLWFDETDKHDGMLRTLVATGQFTTCMNLLEYLISLERKGITFTTAVNAKIAKTRMQLESDLSHFKSDPYFLYDQIALATGL